MCDVIMSLQYQLTNSTHNKLVSGSKILNQPVQPKLHLMIHWTNSMHVLSCIDIGMYFSSVCKRVNNDVMDK